MNVSTHLDTLLSVCPIVLWVEDRVTKEYLRRIWQPDDSSFQILIAGSNENVHSVVHDLRKRGYYHVFGLVDRDFHKSNRSQCNNPSSESDVYRFERFEIENYLLDWAGFAGCVVNKQLFDRTEADIRRRAEKYAQEMLWWMACRQVLSDYHERLLEKFPMHPAINKITSQTDAENHIKTARDWWNQFPNHAVHIQDQQNIAKDLQTAHGSQQSSMNDGTWIENFSGKEIFRKIRGFLFENKVKGVDSETMDIDLAKSVADWQIASNKEPVELLELKDSIKNRV